MHSFPPSEHTKLMNLSIMLGYPNNHIVPILLENGYPIKELGLRIPIPGYNLLSTATSTPTPDAGYSSSEKNAVLFLEAKGGGNDYEQIDKFRFIKQNPNYLVATRNRLGISEENLTIDFVILCSNIQKISDDHARIPIPFPVLYYNEKEKCLTLTDLTGTSFLNRDISETFKNGIKINRLPLIYLPFSSYDLQYNMPYCVQKIFILLIARSGRLETGERLPSLDTILKEDYPIFMMLGEQEFGDLMETVKTIMKKLFPDDSQINGFNIKKYMNIRQGKMYLKKATLKKFLDRINKALEDYQTFGYLSRQSSLLEFDDENQRKHEVYSQIESFFDPLKIFSQSTEVE